MQDRIEQLARVELFSGLKPAALERAEFLDSVLRVYHYPGLSALMAENAHDLFQLTALLDPGLGMA